MWGPSCSRSRLKISAPSRRSLPDTVGQTPTSARTRLVLPEPDGPISPTAIPGSMEKLAPRRTGRFWPGGQMEMVSACRRPSGAGRGMRSGRGGIRCSADARRQYRSRASIHCRQLPIRLSTGANARPSRIEPAIITPGVMRCSITSQAPRPRIRDCADRRNTLARVLSNCPRPPARAWVDSTERCRSCH